MKNTPRDFFVHFGAFATLYLAAIALITLLFRLVDVAFPDPMYSMYYSDPYSGTMRFAIASLIVLVPIFLYLMRMIQKETRKSPERQSLGIRRWLTYITLFIAGATIIGDLIVLLNSFLGGDLPTPFLLKVVILLAIMGAGFWYFILDIRGHWNTRESLSKAIGAALGLGVIAVIIGGFFIMGSPAAQREIRLDQQQVSDLQTIQYQIVTYWQQNQELPSSLTALENDVMGYRIPVAPEDRPAYTYTRESDLSFSLCATFGQDSGVYSASAPESYGIVGTTTWEYSAGEQCFERTIDPALVKPLTQTIF
jgi:hypothetical protein